MSLTTYTVPMSVSGNRNMLTVGDIREMLPMLDDALRNIDSAAPDRRRELHRFTRNCEVKPESWYGILECVTPHDVVRALRFGLESGSWEPKVWGRWSDGIARAERDLLKALSAVELPRVPIFRRQRHWNDDSGEPDAAIVVPGGQHGWRETRKDRKVRGSGRITLIVDVASNCDTDAHAWTMQSAAVRWTVQHLHRLGYRVGVVLVSRSRATQIGAHGSWSDAQPGVSRVFVPASMVASGSGFRYEWIPQQRVWTQSSGKTVITDAMVTALSVCDGSHYDPELIDALGYIVSPAMFRGPFFATWGVAATGVLGYGLGHVSAHMSLAALHACHGDIIPRPFCMMPRSHSGAEAVAGIVSALSVVMGTDGGALDASRDMVEIRRAPGQEWERDK